MYNEMVFAKRWKKERKKTIMRLCFFINEYNTKYVHMIDIGTNMTHNMYFNYMLKSILYTFCGLFECYKQIFFKFCALARY